MRRKQTNKQIIKRSVFDYKSRIVYEFLFELN